jgi:hypothetical protein
MKFHPIKKLNEYRESFVQGFRDGRAEAAAENITFHPVTIDFEEIRKSFDRIRFDLDNEFAARRREQTERMQEIFDTLNATVEGIRERRAASDRDAKAQLEAKRLHAGMCMRCGENRIWALHDARLGEPFASTIMCRSCAGGPPDPQVAEHRGQLWVDVEARMQQGLCPRCGGEGSHRGDYIACDRCTESPATVITADHVSPFVD